MSTVRIRFSDLWTHGDEPGERLDLDALEQNGELGHIHGTLVMEIGGRVVPYLGFFGPDDVCFDAWVAALCTVVSALTPGSAKYTIDEGEQAQPAHRFARTEGGNLSLSIVASAISGGRADPAWQNVTCRFTDFVHAVESFVCDLRDELRGRAPSTWDRWWPEAASLGGE